MKKLLAFALPLVLASCSTSMMMGSTYTLGKQPAAGTLNPNGTVMVKMSGTMVMTDARVMGLLPNQYYVAHYHVQGDKSVYPCESNGAPIMSTAMVGRTDASGMLTLSKSVPSADVKNATYYNIHTAKDASGAPADAGVACTAIPVGSL